MNGTKRIVLQHFSTQRDKDTKKNLKICLLASDAVFSSSPVFHQKKADMLSADG